MSVREPTQAKTAAPARSFSSAQAGLLQRRCACGGVPGLGGECEACRRKRLLGGRGAGLQPKLTVNEPGDQYEQEADRIAEAVMRVPATPTRRPTEPDEEETEVVRAKPLVRTIPRKVAAP